MKTTLQTFVALLLGITIAAQTAPDLQWQAFIGGTMDDFARSVQQTTDGGYIVAGESKSNNGNVSGNHGGSDAWIVKLDADGNIVWRKAFGGTLDDAANSIQQTTDGGYIVAGTTRSNNGDVSGNHGSSDAWVFKLNADGDLLWQKTIGGTSIDQAFCIQQTTDGGYIVAGQTDSNNGDVSGNHGLLDAWAIKLDAGGNLLWQKALGGSDMDLFNSIQQTTDGGYIAAGYSYSNDGDLTGNNGLPGGWSGDVWVVKLDPEGTLQWQKNYGGSDHDDAKSVQQTTDGGYIVAGQTLSPDGDVSQGATSWSVWVLKLHANGTLEWERIFGGTDIDRATGVLQTLDGGYIVGGETESNDGDVSGNHGSFDAWVIKLDPDGKLKWQKTLGGVIPDYLKSIQLTSDGGFIFAGFSYLNLRGADYWIAKLSPENLAVQDTTKENIGFYPNPAKENIYFSEEVKAVVVFDVSGKKVLSHDEATSSLDVKKLTKGIYILKGSTKTGKVFATKIIKE